MIDFVESIFHFKGFQPDHSIERVVPTGHLFIIFELDGITRHTYDKESLKISGDYKKVWVSGMHKDFLSISAHQNSEMLVIQFKTCGAYPFIHTSVSELNNKVINGKELFGESILELREMILNTKNVTDKFLEVENWLIHKMDNKKTPCEDLLEVLNKIQTKSISDHISIVESYSKTQKHLIHQFKTYFGLTPKVFHRIFRFNALLRQIQNKEELIWPQIAYEFGYSDQSHFIKEFKEFSGFNPQEFIRNDFHNDEETNFFPLDREDENNL